MSEREWLVPGGAAVVLQPWERTPLRAESVTIERVMKRDVVLSNGDRFPVAHLQKTIGGSWGTSVYLVPPTDPRVAETRRAIQLSNLKHRAMNAYDEWRRNKVAADEVAAAFGLLANAQATNRTDKGADS